MFFSFHGLMLQYFARKKMSKKTSKNELVKFRENGVFQILKNMECRKSKISYYRDLEQFKIPRFSVQKAVKIWKNIAPFKSYKKKTIC